MARAIPADAAADDLAAIFDPDKDAGYLHVRDGRRDHTPPRPSTSTDPMNDP